MIVNLLFSLAGIISHFILFFRKNFLFYDKTSLDDYSLSIVVPMRNEEENIKKLLNSLKIQDFKNFEVICVNDCSTDNTKEVVEAYEGIVLIDLEKNENLGNGKSYACQVGSDKSKHDLILFLDADVELSFNALSQIVSMYDKYKCSLSVLPYHNVIKNYEEASLFFNLMQVASTGMSFMTNIKKTSLYGPVILINKEVYYDIGGHLSIKNSIVDDVALGRRLTKFNYDYKLFIGLNNFSFRMYPDSFNDLVNGWTKNFSSGAEGNSFVLNLFCFIWVSGMGAIALGLVTSLLSFDSEHFIVYSLFYVIAVILLVFEAKSIANFKIKTIVLYPVYLLFFILVFINSLLKKIFKKPVVWKDRKIVVRKGGES